MRSTFFIIEFIFLLNSSLFASEQDINVGKLTIAFISCYKQAVEQDKVKSDGDWASIKITDTQSLSQLQEEHYGDLVNCLFDNDRLKIVLAMVKFETNFKNTDFWEICWDISEYINIYGMGNLDNKYLINLRMRLFKGSFENIIGQLEQENDTLKKENNRLIKNNTKFFDKKTLFILSFILFNTFLLWYTNFLMYTKLHEKYKKRFPYF